MSPPRLARRLHAPEFFSLSPLLAVALLGVNDAVLKAQFHNAITGKLSDFAGCFFLPLYTSALVKLAAPRLKLGRRLSIGVATTLAIFVPASLSRSAADAICAAVAMVGEPLGFGPFWIAADPTDLIALPFVALAYLYGLFKGAEPCATSASRSTWA
jgi:hypothetical protein